MPTCPAGRSSASSDFCDVCGMQDRRFCQHPAGPPAVPPSEPQPQAPAAPCPRCGTARSGRFCESCGFDFDAGEAPAAAPAARAAPGGDGGGSVEGVAAAQPGTGPAASGSRHQRPAGPPRGHRSRASGGRSGGMDGGGGQRLRVLRGRGGGWWPGCGDAEVSGILPGAPVPAGRAGDAHRAAQRIAGLEPEIDLTGPPTDPGISRLHAVPNR